MDIKPVRRPVDQDGQGMYRPAALPPQPQLPPQQPITPPAPVLKKPRRKKIWLIVIASMLSLGIVLVAIAWIWYQIQLSPVDGASTEKTLVTILPESAPSEIATQLKKEGVIRNETAFLWYTRIQGVQNKLQAGSFRLSPSENTAQIVTHLVSGKVDTFSITFYPGATLVDKVSPEKDRIDATTVLKRAGYGEEEIAAALSKNYDSPIFQDKPSGTDLEGYVFGETYEFYAGASVEDILNRTFQEFNKWVVQDNLIAAYKARGLNLYQGITLASIIQRESGGDDKAQIAQVFYTRLGINMPLGSDVTYQYIADKTGVMRDPGLDSPYNTRRYGGLPPGPIAVPGLASLRAVGAPAPGDYLYFLSGDDNVTYYGRTLEEHEANRRNHCQSKCQII